MQRTTSQERKQNARLFWHSFMYGYCQKIAIVIDSQDSKTNPNIHRVQLKISQMNGPGRNCVIAESVDGIGGCFHELIQNIYGNIEQKNYFEDGFKEWLKKTCHMEITWNDGLVIMIEYWWKEKYEEGCD